MTAAPLDFATLDDRDAHYYLALDHEPVAEPHALYVLAFCGLPDPPPEPYRDDTVDPPERCPFHGGARLYTGWQGPECELCVRARYEARGCRCGGTGKAPEVLAGEALHGGRSSRCEVCRGSSPASARRRAQATPIKRAFSAPRDVCVAWGSIGKTRPQAAAAS